MALILGITCCLIERSVFGYISMTINEKKGYYGGFWWGFFLGVLGILVVAVRSNNYIYYDDNSRYDANVGTFVPKIDEKKRNDDMMNSGGWKCSRCGKVNPSYTGTCSCGMEKYAVLREERVAKQVEEVKEHEQQIIDVIKKYKELLDMGAITQEEFDTKKAELLKN